MHSPATRDYNFPNSVASGSLFLSLSFSRSWIFLSRRSTDLLASHRSLSWRFSLEIPTTLEANDSTFRYRTGRPYPTRRRRAESRVPTHSTAREKSQHLFGSTSSLTLSAGPALTIMTRAPPRLARNSRTRTACGGAHARASCRCIALPPGRRSVFRLPAVT